ncbi:unnamed protein product [Prunus armeniaca]
MDCKVKPENGAKLLLSYVSSATGKRRVMSNDNFHLNQPASVISVKIYGRHNVFWSGRLIHINVPAKTILVQCTHFFPS